MKVSNLPAQITQPFKTLAPAIRCGVVNNSVDTENFDYQGNPNGVITSGKQVGNTYANQSHNFLPCFSSHTQLIEHIFKLKYVEVTYDFTAKWKTPTQQQQSYQGSWNLWLGRNPQNASTAEGDFETYLPYERCCLRYMDQNSLNKTYITKEFSTDTDLYLNSIATWSEPDFFLYQVDLYEEDYYTQNTSGGYDRNFNNFLGRFYSPSLIGDCSFSTTTGETISIFAGYARYNQELTSIPCYHIVDGTSYEGRVYLWDISGYSYDWELTGSFTITFHNYTYNIPS